MRVRWTDRARADARVIRSAAIRTALKRRLQLLREFPRSGRTIPELERDDLREVIVGVFRVCYRIADDAIIVETIFDARRGFQWPGVSEAEAEHLAAA